MKHKTTHQRLARQSPAVDRLFKRRITERSILGQVEVFAKFGVWICGVSYGVGLLIVNTHLLSYGSSHPMFLHSEYVMAGLLWLLLNGIAILISASLFDTVKTLAQQWRTKKRWQYLGWIPLHLLTYPGALLIPVSVVSGWTLTLEKSETWAVIGTLVFSGFFLTYYSRQVGVELNSWRQKGRSVYAFPIQLVSYNLFSCLASFSLYASVAYPQFKPSLGGGKPVAVRIEVEDGSEAVFKSAFGNDFDARTSLLLVAKSDEWLILSTRKGATGTKVTAWVRRAHVAAVIVSSENQ